MIQKGSDGFVTVENAVTQRAFGMIAIFFIHILLANPHFGNGIQLILMAKDGFFAAMDMAAAKEAFSVFLSDVNLDSRQIYFVNQIVEYIVHNGVMKDLSVLQEPPFTDRGSIVEVFTDLSVWLSIKKVIDQINANAAAVA